MAKRVRKIKAASIDAIADFVSEAVPSDAMEKPHVNAHVVRRGSDYVEYVRPGGPPIGYRPPTASAQVEPTPFDPNLVRVYARSQIAAEGPYVDRPMYTEYVEVGKRY